MTSLLTTHRLILLRSALTEYLDERQRREQLLRAYLHGKAAHARASIALGDEIVDARAMLDDVNDLLADATGQPRILKGNADIDGTSGHHALTHEEQGREASIRG